MKFRNDSDKTLDLRLLGLGKCAPGAVVDVPEIFCQPGRMPNGNRRPADVESLAPQLTPADPAEAEEFYAVPEPGQPVSRLRSVGYSHVELSQLPPGIQAAVKRGRPRKDATPEE